jgi:NADP-dependent 3-hydroxy acid dehydrogenase YdfG
MVPVTTVLRSQFITARSVARHLVKQHSGGIIFLTGSPARGHVEGATAIGAGFGAVETLMENLLRLLAATMHQLLRRHRCNPGAVRSRIQVCG